jgi:hypothetical protein
MEFGNRLEDRFLGWPNDPGLSKDVPYGVDDPRSFTFAAWDAGQTKPLLTRAYRRDGYCMPASQRGEAEAVSCSSPRVSKGSPPAAALA